MLFCLDSYMVLFDPALSQTLFKTAINFNLVGQGGIASIHTYQDL